MGRKRQARSPKFKMQVALEAAKGLKTQKELAAEFDVLPSQITEWKQLLLERAVELFSPNHRSSPKQDEEEKSQLYEQIGRLKVENEWLKKKLGH